MLKRIFLVLHFLLFTTFIYSQCDDTIDVCLSVDGSNLNYVSSSDIYGFQFDHDCGLTSPYASGGDAAANGFVVSGSETTVLGFSFTGSFIPAGEGTLVVLEGEGAGGKATASSIMSDLYEITTQSDINSLGYKVDSLIMIFLK